MVTRRLVRIISLILIVVIMIQASASIAFGVSGSDNEQRYYIGSVIKTELNKGYSGEKKIDKDDPHFGWSIGNFFIDGYTSVIRDESCPVFLKNVGDKVTLWFRIEQDINALNGKEDCSISGDKDGYDQYFGIPKTDFGKGTLIVRFKDYQNNYTDPQVYTNYFEAGLSKDADTTVQLFEEGDYEVALNYEIKKKGSPIPIPTYTNYRIFFRFSVRNGNCMIFPFDSETKKELTNGSVSEKGFYLDFARSRYLDIMVKRLVITEGADGIVEDVRFNKPAKDGEIYTDEGVYIVTVKNKYTGEETEKKIYIGKNSMLKAYVVTGLTIPEIKAYVNAGATISNDGTIIYKSNGTEEQIGTAEPVNGSDKFVLTESGDQKQSDDNNKSMSTIVLIIAIIVIIVIVVAVAVVLVVLLRKKGAERVK